MRWRLIRESPIGVRIGLGAALAVVIAVTAWLIGRDSGRAGSSASSAGRSPSNVSGTPLPSATAIGSTSASNGSQSSSPASSSPTEKGSSKVASTSKSSHRAKPTPKSTPSATRGSQNKTPSGTPSGTASATASTTASTTAGAGAPAAQAVGCPAPTVTVQTAAQLSAALAAAKPGDSILIAPGVYTGNFVATVSGTASQPIFLCGSRDAILDGGNIKSGYALHLNPASYWRVVGFTLRNAQKGVVADTTTRSEIQQLDVYDIGDEGIHLRSASTYNTVLNNTVTQTGLHDAKFGEGIYVGSARSNWGNYSGGGPDRSDHNVIQGNTISDTGAESIDIKEGTTGGAILYNSFDGTGMKGADSWVDVKGNDWLIEGNTGRTAPTDGFQTHQILSGWGTGNVFTNNTAEVNASGYGFHLTPIAQNVVSCSNTVSGAGQGLTNTTCTP
jgi:hypothetical protein